MLVVVDTNVLVSALKTPGKKAYLLLEQILLGKMKICISSDIMTEYKDVLYRDRLGLDKHLVDYLMSWFVLYGLWIEPLPSSKERVVMADESDRKFFDVAKCLHAKLVTGNFKHYPVDELITSINDLIL